MVRTKQTEKAPAKRARKTEPSLPKKPVEKKPEPVMPFVQAPEPIASPLSEDPFDFVNSFSIGRGGIVESIYAFYIGGEGSLIRTVHSKGDNVLDVDVMFVPNTQAIDGKLRRKLK